MKYQELEKYSFVLEENQKIYKVEEKENEIHIYIKTEKHECECPLCHKKTSRMVSTYKRKVQDTPITNKTVYLHITAGEYQCENKDCRMKYFCEELELVCKGQRRTKRLNEFILAGSVLQSAKSSELTLGMQGVIISHDSIQRLFARLEFEDRPDVECIGIDEIAIKKGQKYATVIYDYDDGTLLTLIIGKKKGDIIPWLEKHKNIKFVARDRASGYTSAISEVLPEAEQIADRFHLFLNLNEYLKKWNRYFPKKALYFQGEQLLEKKPKKSNYYPEVEAEKLENLSYDNSVPVDDEGKEIKFDNKVRDLTNSQSKKQAQRRIEKKKLVEQIREDYFSKEGSTYAELARKYQKDSGTIKRYIQMSREEVDRLEFTHKYKKKSCRSDSYINIIYKMLRDGHKFSTIAGYISRQEFFNDTSANLSVTIRFIAKANFENWQSLNSNDLKANKLPEEISTLKASDIRRLIANRNRSELEEKRLEQIIEKYPIYGDYKEIFDSFHNVIMGKGKLDLDKDFIEKYSCVLPEFCNGLKEDNAAVQNAIIKSMSSGLVEGNNNKVKLIKRILYGRSGIVNLGIRCVLAFKFNEEDFQFSDYLKTA